MQQTAQVNGSTKILITVVASQELEVGDVLRRFKAEVSQDEPRRGNNANRRTSATSAWFWDIVTVYLLGLFLFALVLVFLR